MNWLTTTKEYSDRYKKVSKDLRKQILYRKMRVMNRHQDTFIFIGGDTGAGKSVMAMHLVDLWTNGHITDDMLILDDDDIKNRLRECIQETDVWKRVIWYDEANITTRRAMSGENVNLIKLYRRLRELQGLHIFCNPSVHDIDYFVTDRAHLLIWLIGKDKYVKKDDGTKVPYRNYFLFTKENLMRVVSKYGRLTVDKMKSIGGKECNHIGNCFMYEGEFFDIYKRKKQDRLVKNVMEFTEMIGGDKMYSLAEAGRTLLVSPRVLKLYVDEMKQKGVLTNGNVSPLGRRYYSEEEVQKIKEYLLEAKQNDSY